MTSQIDYDQGGTFRQFERVWLGPSVGWAYYPQAVTLPLTVAGTATISRGVTLVTVNVNGAVTINLPSSKATAQPLAIPSQWVLAPVTVVDIGGFASANPITIAAAGSELISGLASVSLSVVYGAVILKPMIDIGGWTLLS
jgi:hypothetical protein